MKQSIEIIEDLIYATDDCSRRTFVLPKNKFREPVSVENDNLLSGIGAKYSRNLVIDCAKKNSAVSQKYIIRCGEFVDVKRALQVFDIYIENDEIIPQSILKLIAGGEQVYVNGKKLSDEFAIPTSEWKEPTKSYSIRTRSDYVLINVNEYHQDDVKRVLHKYNNRYNKISEVIFTETHVQYGKDMLSGGFLLNLMKNVVETPVKKEIEETNAPTRTIIGFRREGKKTAAYYSDNSIEIDNNNENIDSDPKIPSVCKNILMNWDNTHMTLNCSSKIRKIAFNEIQFAGPNYDGTYMFILGNDEKITETIRIHFGAIEDSGIQKIKDLLFKRIPSMCR